MPDEDPWPRVIDQQGSTIKIYQPQLKSWMGNSLDAYCAVSVKNQASGVTEYEVIWFTATTDVDKVNRIVMRDNL